jgi:hypothetical protein
MTERANTPSQAGAPAVSHAEWFRIAAGAMVALAGASSLVLLDRVHVGPVWVHWVVSLVALAAALGVLVIADLGWQRAVAAAEDDGLVERPTDSTAT